MVKQQNGSAKAGPFRPTEQIERNRQICEEYCAGASGPQLAAKYNICSRRIYQILKRELIDR